MDSVASAKFVKSILVKAVFGSSFSKWKQADKQPDRFKGTLKIAQFGPQHMVGGRYHPRNKCCFFLRRLGWWHFGYSKSPEAQQVVTKTSGTDCFRTVAKRSRLRSPFFQLSHTQTLVDEGVCAPAC